MAPTTIPDTAVIKGRRWRITDPSIPEPLRQALVDELMSARRAVGAGGRADDPEAVLRARARVQDAKVALGGARTALVVAARRRRSPGAGDRGDACPAAFGQRSTRAASG